MNVSLPRSVAQRYHFFQDRLRDFQGDLSLDFNDRPIEFQGNSGELVQIRCGSTVNGNLEIVSLSQDERLVSHEVYQPTPDDPSTLHCLKRVSKARNLRGPGPIPIPGPHASPVLAVLSQVDRDTGDILSKAEGSQAVEQARHLDWEFALADDFRLLRE